MSETAAVVSPIRAVVFLMETVMKLMRSDGDLFRNEFCDPTNLGKG